MSKSNGAATAAKLRAMADKMQGEIDGKFADRLTNTPKRAREAQSARLDGYRLQRTQSAMRKLADLHEAGTISDLLAGLTTKAAIFKLAYSPIINDGGYYDAGRESGKPGYDTPEAHAMWALLDGRSEADEKADKLRELTQRLKFSNIPGYFPTPAFLVERMIEEADIETGCSALEPSAGSGAILDRLAPLGCKLYAFERHSSLREMLSLKGYDLAGDDFMESDYGLKVDRVLMNPPFENGQDITHVMRAFVHLKPGGRLVAIMSTGPFFRQDARARAFREWFDRLGGEKTDIPAGAFKDSGTNVPTVLVSLAA